MPMAPRSHSNTGRPPAGDLTSRQIAAASKVGISVISQTTSSIDVAEVDQGNATASVTAAQSASCASCLQSTVIDERTRSGQVVRKVYIRTKHVGCAWRTSFPLLGFAPIQCFERIKDAAGLTPQRCFISAEAIEREVGQIGETQKAARELDGGSIVFLPKVRHQLCVTYRNVRSCMRAPETARWNTA